MIELILRLAKTDERIRAVYLYGSRADPNKTKRFKYLIHGKSRGRIRMKCTHITFDFDGEWRESIERLEQIICSTYWASGINITTNDDHILLLELVRRGIIVIDEYEYELQEPPADSENARLFMSILGKRSPHHVLWKMTAIFADELFESADNYRNTIYLPNLKAYMRADGMKPEDIAEMLASDVCDKIILFPYFPLDDKPAYYELTLGIEKVEFTKYMSLLAE